MTVEGGRTARCSSCSAAVFWRVNDATGNRAPIDALPTDEGNIVLVQPDGFHVLTAAELDQVDPDRPRYRSHFATCPRAHAHRGSTRKPKPTNPDQGRLL